MTERVNRAELKKWRGDSQIRRVGYPEAKDAFRLGAKVRDNGCA